MSIFTMTVLTTVAVVCLVLLVVAFLGPPDGD